MMGWRSVGSVAFLVTSLTAMTLFAAPTTAPSEQRNWLRQASPAANSSPAPQQLSLGKWLAAGLLVGLSGFALLKRRKLRAGGIIPAISQIQISAVTKISPKAQLVVATVKGRSLLLGVTESNVTRLMWLDDAEEEDDLQEGSDRYARERGIVRPSERAGSDLQADPLELRRKAAAAAKAPPRASSRKSDKRSGSRFREILADAIGITPKSEPPAAPTSAPVDALIAAAEDRYVGRDTRRMPTRQGQKTAPIGPVIDIEGQAAGLIARLNR